MTKWMNAKCNETRGVCTALISPCGSTVQLTIIRVYLRADEGECLLWGVNGRAG